MVLIPAKNCVVEACVLQPTHPDTSQSPAVKEILVTVFAVLATVLTGEERATFELILSPIYPALASSFVDVPAPISCPLNVFIPEAVWLPIVPRTE